MVAANAVVQQERRLWIIVVFILLVEVHYREYNRRIEIRLGKIYMKVMLAS